jgi:hypothetical protein
MASSASVRVSSCPWRSSSRFGFSTRCAVASAAESVIVMMKSVAANPSSTSTNSLPFQKPISRSSIAIEPSPCGLSSATLRYTGRAPNNVSSTRTTVATGLNKPAARAAMPGW